jgi:dATP pyrophosphohydrolase
MRIPHEVMTFVRRGDELLVLHRSPRFEAYWHVVAGALEEGETPRDAAIRELEEEVQLDADETLVDLERRYVYALADESEAVRFRFDPSVAEIVVDCFVAEAPAGWEPTLNDEHDDYRWCSTDEAAELLYWPEPRELARSLP